MQECPDDKTKQNNNLQQQQQQQQQNPRSQSIKHTVLENKQHQKCATEKLLFQKLHITENFMHRFKSQATILYIAALHRKALRNSRFHFNDHILGFH